MPTTEQVPLSSYFLVITGHPRSGTTILNYVVNSHPHVVTTFEFKSLPAGTTGLGQYLRGIRSDYGQRRIVTPPQKMSQRNRQFYNLSFYWRYVFWVALFSRGTVTADSVLRAYRRVYPGLLVYGDKHPQYYIDRLDDFLHIANTKIVCIYRDGRDVVTSVLNRSWGDGRSNRFATARTTAASWVTAIDVMEKNAEHLHIIRYEDFTANPKGTMGALGEFLGVDGSLFDTSVVTDNRSGKHSVPGEGLSADQLDDVLDVATPTLERLGYL